jgi:hypothetical protein
MRASDIAMLIVPVSTNPVEKPVSSSSVRKVSMLRWTIARVPHVRRAWVTRPAACHVVPEVSVFCSRSTTSLQPRLARWYAVLAPITPPPTMTTWARVGSSLAMGSTSFVATEPVAPGHRTPCADLLTCSVGPVRSDNGDVDA